MINYHTDEVVHISVPWKFDQKHMPSSIFLHTVTMHHFCFTCIPDSTYVTGTKFSGYWCKWLQKCCFASCATMHREIRGHSGRPCNCVHLFSASIYHHITGRLFRKHFQVVYYKCDQAEHIKYRCIETYFLASDFGACVPHTSSTKPHRHVKLPLTVPANQIPNSLNCLRNG